VAAIPKVYGPPPWTYFAPSLQQVFDARRDSEKFRTSFHLAEHLLLGIADQIRSSRSGC